MAKTIYKVVQSVRRGAGTTVLHSTSETGVVTDFTAMLANYYTKNDMQTSGSALVHFDNVTEAYHNNLLDLQGGLDSSSGDSSGSDAEYYHLDLSTYLDITGISFVGSLEKDSINAVSLIGDLDSPGNEKYYGTDGTGIKGWHDLPSSGIGVNGSPAAKDIAVYFDADTITNVSGFYYNDSGEYTYLYIPFYRLVLGDEYGVQLYGKNGDSEYSSGGSLSFFGGTALTTGSGKGGSILFYAGGGYGTTIDDWGGAIEFVGGTQNGSTGSVSGGYVNIQGGGTYSANGFPGYVNIEGGSSLLENGKGGDVYISSGKGLTRGNVYLATRTEAGCLPEVDSSDVIYVVTYNPDNGKLGYTQLI